MNILAYGRDPGGSNAITPVVKELLKDSSHHVTLYSRDWGSTTFSRYKLPSETYPTDADLNKLMQNIDLVLTATSWPPLVEHDLWRKAEELKIPSIVVLD